MCVGYLGGPVLMLLEGSPHWRQRVTVDVEDTCLERWRGFDCAQEGPGDSARERGARGAERDS
jgi:hypothetical protein